MFTNSTNFFVQQLYTFKKWCEEQNQDYHHVYSVHYVDCGRPIFLAWIPPLFDSCLTWVSNY